MVKKKRHKAFWSNIKFKYKLTIINENTLEEVVGLRVSKLNGISVLLSVLTVLFLVASVITLSPYRFITHITLPLFHPKPAILRVNPL